MFKVTDRKYFSEWGNGTTFASNLSDYATHLKGCVGERIKSVITVEVALLAEATDTAPFKLTGPGGAILKRSTGSWIADGFVIGQTVILVDGYALGTPTTVFTDTILAITPTEITLTTGGYSVADYTDSALIVANAPTGLIYNYGLIENSGAENYASPYTDDLQGYYFGGIDVATPTAHTMTPAGGTTASKSWKSGDATVKWLSSDDPASIGSDYLHTYEITQIFVINPIYTEEVEDNIADDTQPDNFIGGNSIKHITQFEFRTVLTNPNTSIKGEDSLMVGSVGWIGENYNGFNDIYSVSSVVVKDHATNEIIEALQTKRKSNISGDINGAGFTNTDKVGVYLIYCAPQTKYEGQDSFQDTFLYESKIGTMVAGTFDVAGPDMITRVQVNYGTASRLTFSIDIDYDSDQREYIGAAGKYMVLIQVGNNNSVDSSNKVIKLVHFDDFIVATDVSGLATFSGQSFYPHNLDESAVGFTDFKGWKGDGCLFKSQINLNKADDANLDSLTFRLVAYKTSDGSYFELQNYQFDLSGIVTGAYQQLTLDSTRGFQLADDDQFNFVKLDFGIPSSGIQVVEMALGFKFDWQSWVQLPGADGIFYDASLDSKGRGLDASRYSMNEGYEIKILIEAGIKQLTDDVTIYRDLSPDLDIYGYGEDGNDPANWSVLIETFDSEDNDLGGAILANEDTKMKVTWTPQSGSTAGFDEAWAIHRIEQKNAKGYNSIYELSTLRDYPTDNLLKPLTGETALKITVSPTEIVTECLIDWTKLNGSNYNLFARMGRDKIYGRYNKAKDFKFLDVAKTEAISFNGETVTPLSNALRLCTLDASYKVVAEEAIALTNNYYVNPRFAVDYNEQVNGKSVFYMISFNGTDTSVYRFVYNGTTFNQSTVFSANIGGSNPSCIRIDESISPNGRALLWYGNKSATISGNRGFRTSYWNGASWVNGEFKTGDVGSPSTNECCLPVDLIFDNADMYIMNYDSPPQAVNAFKGKISKFYQTSGSLVDPVDRVNPANWAWQNDIYINSADTQDTDGLGSVSDCAFGLGFERLEVDGNSNPVFLVCHDSSLGSGGSRHWSRVYANTAAPAGPADWNIQTPMAFTNGSSGGTEAISGTASATAQSSPLRNHKSCHVAIIDGNSWITGNEAFYWVRFYINDWSGGSNNVWVINAPADNAYTFTSGNELTEA